MRFSVINTILLLSFFPTSVNGRALRGQKKNEFLAFNIDDIDRRELMVSRTQKSTKVRDGSKSASSEVGPEKEHAFEKQESKKGFVCKRPEPPGPPGPPAPPCPANPACEPCPGVVPPPPGPPNQAVSDPAAPCPPNPACEPCPAVTPEPPQPPGPPGPSMKSNKNGNKSGRSQKKPDEEEGLLIEEILFLESVTIDAESGVTRVISAGEIIKKENCDHSDSYDLALLICEEKFQSGTFDMKKNTYTSKEGFIGVDTAECHICNTERCGSITVNINVIKIREAGDDDPTSPPTVGDDPTSPPTVDVDPTPPPTVDIDPTPIIVDDGSLVAEPDNYTTDENTSITMDVLANDTPSDAVLETHTVPLYGTMVTNEDQTLTYTPDVGFTGFDTFVYVITNPGAVDPKPEANARVWINIE